MTAPCRCSRRLIILRPLDRPEVAQTYRAALPEATIALCRMDVSRAHLDERIARRSQGEAPDIDGGELKGLSQEALREVGDRFWAEAVAFERSGIADFSAPAYGRTGPQIAEEILDQAGWVRPTGTPADH